MDRSFIHSRFAGILTVFQSCGVDLRAGRPSSGSVEGLDDNAVLGKLLQIVQRVDLAVSGGFHLHDAVLAIAAGAVLPVADLVTPDHTVLQFLPRSLDSAGQKRGNGFV